MKARQKYRRVGRSTTQEQERTIKL